MKINFDTNKNTHNPNFEKLYIDKCAQQLINRRWLNCSQKNILKEKSILKQLETNEIYNPYNVFITSSNDGLRLVAKIINGGKHFEIISENLFDEMFSTSTKFVRKICNKATKIWNENKN